VLFLVAGKKKREIVDTIVKEGDGAAERYPAARIRASEQVVFFYA
jgi:6-phosphogluconolactonase/glucosamine-6-phosphate isomerase/deaminase